MNLSNGPIKDMNLSNGPIEDINFSNCPAKCVLLLKWVHNVYDSGKNGPTKNLYLRKNGPAKHKVQFDTLMLYL